MIGGAASESGWEFERFVGELVAAMPGATEVNVETGIAGDLGVDISARLNGEQYLIVVKLRTPQTSTRLQEMASRLKEAADRYREVRPGAAMPRLVLTFPGVLSARNRTEAVVDVWDGQFLRTEALRLGVRAPAALNLAEVPPFTDDHPTVVMEKRLNSIEPGRADWRYYENFCEDLLNMLFSPPLNTVIPQSRNDSGVNRRDFVLPNYSQSGFWHFMRLHYKADFVIAEAKNSAGGVGKDGVLQLSNYLNRHGTGLFGVLVTRRGLASDAKVTVREQWISYDKLIVGLNDDDCFQMLATKRSGGDPSDLVRQKIEDFRLSI